MSHFQPLEVVGRGGEFDIKLKLHLLKLVQRWPSFFTISGDIPVVVITVWRVIVKQMWMIKTAVVITWSCHCSQRFWHNSQITNLFCKRMFFLRTDGAGMPGPFSPPPFPLIPLSLPVSPGVRVTCGPRIHRYERSIPIDNPASMRRHMVGSLLD